MNKFPFITTIKQRISLALFLVLFSCTEPWAQDKHPDQESTYKPFTVLILSPEGATIDESLNIFTDSIEFEFRDTYFRAVQEIETKVASEKKQESRKKAESKLHHARLHETDIYDFKYYKMISIGTLVTLLERFNMFPSAEKSLTCEIAEKWELHTDDLAEVAAYMEVDYIIFYKNVRTEKKEDGFILKMTTLVFSKADAAIIVEKETEGVEKTYYCQARGENPLMCLLTTVIESSTHAVIDVLTEKQQK